MEYFYLAIKDIFRNRHLYNKEAVKALDKSNFYKELIIFGAGELGHKVYDILKDGGMRVSRFCDNLLCGRTDEATGLEIAALKDLEPNRENIFVLIAVFDDKIYEVVYRQLLDFGYKKEQLINAKNMADVYPVSYLKQNFEKYQEVYSLLEDDFSKKVYISMIQKAYLNCNDCN